MELKQMTDSTQRSHETASDAGDSDLQFSGIRIDAARVAAQDTILSVDALAFLGELHRRFDSARHARLTGRRERQARFDAKELPDFRADTATIRAGNWRVAEIPA